MSELVVQTVAKLVRARTVHATIMYVGNIRQELQQSNERRSGDDKFTMAMNTDVEKDPSSLARRARNTIYNCKKLHEETARSIQ